ncbi:NAD(P)H-dependent oxidoreductase [Amycolatopsis sp. PS_44_ISF1]|uniref:NADPH-dependent FMN reductase n=1 Tax=Amycolatopsis sp. PS_44_ISF1 TaxID=2974917 RepID=UPI0028DE6D2C|nr:NAD(P)H-dependent oxidoreductase [Amycolatopsis sp. PS_44_ISF1]MDT8914915.1 NAD(P)H-dependent oxidoreductase [Amycolatopsis sp. PS_44_ISF1]
MSFEVSGWLAELGKPFPAADAFVVITPEYNHSHPASLKNLVDWLTAGWRAKPVAFVSYGELFGGLRAVTIRETVGFHDGHGRFEPDGSPKDAPAVAVAAKALLDQLEWWVRSLAQARTTRPCPA